MNIKVILHKLRHPLKSYQEYTFKEKRIYRKKGLHPNETYYVIRCNLPECGLFAIYMYILDHVAFAIDHGYIPVLDCEQYKCLYKENKPIKGVKDPWRYYFEKLSPVSLEDCKKFQNVIYGPIKFLHYKAIYYYSDQEKNILPEKRRIAELSTLVQSYMQFRPELKQELDEQAKKLNHFQRILGIHVRGTDMYTEGKQHPVPTGNTKDFSIIDKILEENQIDGIFLCTDTMSTVKLFKDYYGNRVITNEAVRQINDLGSGIHKDTSLGIHRNNHKYMLGIEVITDMYMLAQCDVLLCGPSNVAFVALIHNNNRYDKVYYYA
ncbi:MAG: hypothetical protein ACLUPE_02900 [Turicibacter sanguinis]|uniref:hypothetical protein n=1 Tax=Turicibacter sanguinis TaxID=154288 RepID=UPI003996C1AD